MTCPAMAEIDNKNYQYEDCLVQTKAKHIDSITSLLVNDHWYGLMIVDTGW